MFRLDSDTARARPKHLAAEFCVTEVRQEAGALWWPEVRPGQPTTSDAEVFSRATLAAERRSTGSLQFHNHSSERALPVVRIPLSNTIRFFCNRCSNLIAQNMSPASATERAPVFLQPGLSSSTLTPVSPLHANRLYCRWAFRVGALKGPFTSRLPF
jgi:hypothetical protein